jgi:hypothetical protein
MPLEDKDGDDVSQSNPRNQGYKTLPVAGPTHSVWKGRQKGLQKPPQIVKLVLAENPESKNLLQL